MVEERNFWAARCKEATVKVGDTNLESWRSGCFGDVWVTFGGFLGNFWGILLALTANAPEHRLNAERKRINLNQPSILPCRLVLGGPLLWGCFSLYPFAEA